MNHRKRIMASALTGMTIILLCVGTICFFSKYIGWAQTAWVVASGTSGAAVVLWLELWMERKSDV